MTNHLRLLGPWALAAGLSWSWATAADGPGPRAGAAPRGVQSGGLDDLRDDPLSGHDGRGTPRDGIDARPAMLLEGVGTADFPATTGQPLAQRYIDQGVALLHGLWFDEAGRSFRRAAQLDGRCAIAYWGMALASPHDEQRAAALLAPACHLRKISGNVTSREGMYIDALAAYLRAGPGRDRERREEYVRALERILAQHPDDREARAFLALQLWSNRRVGLPIGSAMAADALLRLVLAQAPDHPCQLTRLLLWEDEPAIALDTAARCGRSAPGNPVMWHLPGHLYARAGRLDEALWQYEAAARVYNAHATRAGLLPDQVAGLAHNAECLGRCLARLGRVRAALEVAQRLIDLPRHPASSRPGACAGRGRRLRLAVLAQFELWDELIAEAQTIEPGTSEDPIERAHRLLLLGRAHFARGDATAGRIQLSAVQGRGQRLKADADTTIARAGAAERPTVRARLEAESRALDAAADELTGRAAIAAGQVEAGIRLLKGTGLDGLELARALFRAGRGDEAENLAMDEAARCPAEPLPLAILVEIRWQCGRLQEGEQALDALREVSAGIDLDAPAFARLAPIARTLGHPGDWRIGRPAAATAAARPPLDALGPARWQPATAPAWSLKDARDAALTLDQYRGRPVVLIFYLGAGCLHCVEQLNAFAPKTGEFADAGIALVGISTDDRPTLRKSFEEYGSDGFPFPLASDAESEIFRRYRAYDETTGTPLHGTFLIDGAGRIRWGDIGHEPFMDADFVLKESRRLLSLGPAESVRVITRTGSRRGDDPRGGGR